MPTVWFIRHAESEANVGRPTACPTTVDLTPQGIEQANSIASFFKRPLDLIITSPYIRTFRTAQPTCNYFPNARHEVWPVEEFTYLAPINTLTTSLERKPRVEIFWQREDPFYIDGENVESFVTFIARVQQAVKRLRQMKDHSIAVFSHEQFISAMIWLFFQGKLESDLPLQPDSKKQFRDFLKLFPIPNGAILPVELLDGGETWISRAITDHLPP